MRSDYIFTIKIIVPGVRGYFTIAFYLRLLYLVVEPSPPFEVNHSVMRYNVLLFLVEPSHSLNDRALGC